MSVSTHVVKTVQRELNKEFNLSLAVDGIIGKNTLSAIDKVNEIPLTWSDDRKIIGYLQHICAKNGINAGPVDGFWGPQTEYGYDILEGKLDETWRDDEGIGGDPSSGKWPLQTQEELERFYGPVGTNQTKVDVPYKLKIAWNTEQIVTRFSCHEKVAPSIARVLDRVLDHYGEDEIERLGLNLWGGCLNVRKMRGGTKWSTHAWGIAIDWDPAHNKLRWGADKARLAQPEYDMWWKLWEEEGWVSLGKTRNYDWMHVQASRVKP